MIINENTKNEKGITLIALVITIIVLLILAAVSIAMLTGENGILKKASSAKEETKKAELIELAQTDIIEKQADNNGSITKKDLKSVLNKYFLSVPDDLNNNTKLTANSNYGSYEIALSDIYNGKITEYTENNVTEKMIADNPSKYYGKKVTNYTSTNG